MSPARPAGRELYFALAVTALFLVLAGFSTLHHEMWRDEMGPWLIARDSRTLFDIFHNIRYDGHPSLWYLLLWPLTRLTSDPAAMQWLNLAVGAGAVFLIAKAAPGPRWVRVLFALGYFPVYEYGSIARNYSLGVLALAAFCAVFPRRREHPYLLGVLLLVAANSSIHACILAIAAVMVLAVAALLDRGGISKGALGGLAVAAAGILFSVYLIIPPADTGYAMGWHFGFEGGRVAEVLKHVTAAYLPLPKPGPVFWETELFAVLSPAYRAFSWLLAPLIVLLAAIPLARRPLALLYYLAGTAGLTAFFYIKHVGYLRHHGFLFLCFGTALWLAGNLEPARLPEGIDDLVRRLERPVGLLLPVLLGLQLVSALIAVGGEYRYTFSAGRETAELLRAEGVEKLPLIADLDVTGMTVVGYLNKPSAFYPCGDRYGSYVIWDTARMQHTIVWQQAARIASQSGSPVVVLADDFVMTKFPPPTEMLPKLRLLGSRKAGIATEESYCAYLFDPGTGSSHAR